MKIKYKYSKVTIIVVLLFSLTSISSCKKFIEVDPPSTSINEGNVYADDATAAAEVTGIYTKMADGQFSLNLTVLPELAADNLNLFLLGRPTYTAYYQNTLSPADPEQITKFWLVIYPYIFNTNSAIEGLTKSQTLTPAVKQNLLGEAYFLRAFFYFYLVNLYGEVPLALSTDYTINNKLVRSSEEQVYTQIIDDLKKAQALLSDNFLTADAVTSYPAASAERVRPNKSAATALLARVLLYRKDYANAEISATEVINKTTLFGMVPLNQIFLKNSKETIWSLQGVKISMNTDEGNLFVLRPGGPTDSEGRVIYLSDDFMKTFQTGDQRKVVWTGSQTDVNNTAYPYSAKYKVIEGEPEGQEYAIVLRYAEQLLIRAEARIQQGKIADGITDLNTIRDRAIDKSEADENKQLKPLPSSLSKEEAMTALMYERRVELFCEWGHRWFDLRRTGMIDDVMKTTSPKKGGEWKPFKALLPVPAEERAINTNLSQNNGYLN